MLSATFWMAFLVVFTALTWIAKAGLALGPLKIHRRRGKGTVREEAEPARLRRAA